MKLYHVFIGARRVSVALSDAAVLLNVCMKYRFPYCDMQTCGERVFVTCTAHTAARIAIRCAEMGIAVETGELRGLPRFFVRYRRRYGLMLGLVCAAALCFASTRLVWDVRVTAPGEGVTEEEVLAELAVCGFGKGTSLVNFDADRVENSVIAASGRLSWISINMKGTVAYVEAREKLSRAEPEGTKPANVVAARHGIITEIIAYHGLRQVNAGDAVVQGQLLISGTYGEKTHGLLVTRAAGRVMAKTKHELTVEIPLEYYEKVPTGDAVTQKYLIFFGNRIKVFGNSGNLGVSCDKIVDGKEWSVFGTALPMGLEREIYEAFSLVRACRTVDEARQLAAAELERRISEELADAEVLSRTPSEGVSDGVFRLTCIVYCIEDISRTAEFEVQYGD